MKFRLHVDFETRATMDLRRCGVYVYADHPDTDLIMAAWAMNEGPVRWTGLTPAARAVHDELDRFMEALHAADEIVAHNAGFERLMFNGPGRRYGLPSFPADAFDCTAARAAIQSLPRSLNGALSALGAPVEKDMQGHALMMRMCRPRSTNPLTWWEDEERIRRLAEYMVKDVEGERYLDKILAPMSDQHRATWLQNERMNDRGVPIDTVFVNDARWLAFQGVDELDADMRRITKGAVPKASNVTKLKAWIKGQCGIDVDLVEDEEGNFDLDKQAVTALLAQGALPPDVRLALKVRQEAGKASIAKYQALIDRTSKDGRARGNLVYHGASTGRFAGSGVQMQNMPRNVTKEFERFATLMRQTPTPQDFYNVASVSPMTALQGMIRGAVRTDPARGTVLWWADYAAVEARGVAWLAGADTLTNLFASGGKIYEHMAGVIYGVDAGTIGSESVERFVGKQVVLGCGYGMGWRKFLAQCAVYGVTVDEGTAQRAVSAYRESNPEIPALWRGLEEAAISAVQNPGRVFSYRKIAFKRDGQWLKMRLPSGRLLYYCRPRIEDGEYGPVLTYEAVNSYTKKWEREKTWGGKLTENAVQGLCADLMTDALQRLERRGLFPILSVHDEIICEVSQEIDANVRQEYMADVMSILPEWAKGFPLKAEAKKGFRYGK
jgi:DNA polymerase